MFNYQLGVNGTAQGIPFPERLKFCLRFGLGLSSSQSKGLKAFQFFFNFFNVSVFLLDLPDGHSVADFNMVRRDINFFAVNFKKSVVYQLPGLRPGFGKAQAVNNIIQPGFQKPEQDCRR